MSAFELWLKACQEFNTKIYPLEGEGDHALYKSWRDYEYKWNYYHLQVTFHVWYGHLHECYLDYQTAIKRWRDLSA